MRHSCLIFTKEVLMGRQVAFNSGKAGNSKPHLQLLIKLYTMSWRNYTIIASIDNLRDPPPLRDTNKKSPAPFGTGPLPLSINYFQNENLFASTMRR